MYPEPPPEELALVARYVADACGLVLTLDKSYLMVLAARKKVLEKQLELLQGRDVDPYFIDLDILCMYNALAATGYLQELDRFILVKFELAYLRTIAFILVIASLVQFVEMFLKKSIPALYAGLGIFLPLITTNCAVMGACLININEEYNFMEALVASFSYAVGFGLALILFAGVPKPFQDTSIALVTAGVLSLTFFAFKGMV